MAGTTLANFMRFLFIALCFAIPSPLLMANDPLSAPSSFVSPLSSGVVAGESLLTTLSEALESNPRLIIKRSELAAAGYELDAAEWGRWPSAGLESKVLDDGFELVARVEQPLWAGGRISGQIEVSEANRDLALLALQETHMEILLETSSRFFEALQLRERLRFALLNEQEHVRLLEMIQRRVQSQISPGSDQILASSRMRRAMTTRLQIERQLREAQVALERALGRPAALPLLQAPERLDLGAATQADFISRAQSYSPTRQRLQATVLKAAADIVVARAQTLPTLVAGFEQTLSEADRDRNSDGRVYLALNVQTGAGLSGRATVSAASSRRAAAQQEIVDQERELRQRVQSLWAEVVALDDQLEPMRVIVSGSEEMVASYLRQFQVGKKSWLDVLNAQNEKAQAYFLETDTVMPLLRAKFHLLVLAGDVQAQMTRSNPQ